MQRIFNIEDPHDSRLLQFSIRDKVSRGAEAKVEVPYNRLSRQFDLKRVGFYRLRLPYSSSDVSVAAQLPLLHSLSALQTLEDGGARNCHVEFHKPFVEIRDAHVRVTGFVSASDYEDTIMDISDGLYFATPQYDEKGNIITPVGKFENVISNDWFV